MPPVSRPQPRARLPAVLSRWAPRRFPVMNTTAKVILATAVVAFAVVVGYNYLVAPNVGGPRLFAPDPTPTPVPSLEVGAGRLPPGAYQITDLRSIPRITMTVPNGWESNVASGDGLVRGRRKGDGCLFHGSGSVRRSVRVFGLAGDRANRRRIGRSNLHVPGHLRQLDNRRHPLRVQRKLLDVTTTERDCHGSDPFMWRSTQPGSIDRPHPGEGHDSGSI